ncbi:MAG: hypothetical protein H7039_12925 [Bryobacteraceae bacterium]|nr:hypothetical protein [Bryobacteraceae bacterium]
MEYQSVRVVESAVCAGVRFSVARISFGRRLELTRRVRELGRKIEFDEAGDSLDQKLSAAIARVEIDRLYIDWGLTLIEGLSIDGQIADKQNLLAAGPEELCREISAEIRQECGLSEEERKN